MNVTPKRERALIRIYEQELAQTLDLGDYHQFDHLIECDETVSFEEWEWMNRRWKAEVKLVAK